MVTCVGCGVESKARRRVGDVGAWVALSAAVGGCGASGSRITREAVRCIRPLLDQVCVGEGCVGFWGAGVAASGGGGGPDDGVAVFVYLPESGGCLVVVEVAGGVQVLLAGAASGGVGVCVVDFACAGGHLAAREAAGAVQGFDEPAEVRGDGVFAGVYVLEASGGGEEQAPELRAGGEHQGAGVVGGDRAVALEQRRGVGQPEQGVGGDDQVHHRGGGHTAGASAGAVPVEDGCGEGVGAA